MDDAARALRRLAADLARLEMEDVQSILAELDPSARRRVVDLIARFKAGSLSSIDAPAEPGPAYSDWIESRLASSNGAGIMTEQARAKLRGLAAQSGWVGQRRPSTRTPKGASNFMALLRGGK